MQGKLQQTNMHFTDRADCTNAAFPARTIDYDADSDSVDEFGAEDSDWRGEDEDAEEDSEGAGEAYLDDDDADMEDDEDDEEPLVASTSGSGPVVELTGATTW